jgi:hypothetical protein
MPGAGVAEGEEIDRLESGMTYNVADGPEKAQDGGRWWELESTIAVRVGPFDH